MKSDIFDRIMELSIFQPFRPVYLRYKEILLYLFFGGLTTILSIGSFAYCTIGLAYNPLLANVISWILAVTFAYVTNRIWVFSSKARSLKERAVEAASFYSGRLTTLLIEEVLLYLFIRKLHMNSLLVKTAAQFFVLISNYMISKFLVFKRK